MGDIFGKYELVKKIARGGMAEVFLARQDGEIGGFSKHVAIKRLFPHLTEDQETIDMFLDEGRIAASLTHSNIVQIYDLDVVDDFLYIAMEYVHGRDLRSILEEGYNQDNFIPIELAASLGAQVAAGLHYAHTRAADDGSPMNIVHRDISPQNILVSVDGEVKVCDFGIAKAEHRLSHTKAGQVKGKFSYMAPEQIETSEVDPRSDVFALGIVLYETTTMTRLFRADNQYEALEKILYAGIEPPTALRAGYPPELEKLVMKALERDPAARFQTAAQMQEELDNWLVQNQASTGPVPLARYMRSLFPELAKPPSEQVAESTGPMQVSEEIVKAVDGKAPSDLDKTVVEEFDREAALKAAKEAQDGAAASKSQDDTPKKDVTEMDEDDLDAALDFALGAPSEADVVAHRPTSEATDASAETDYGGEDATMISTHIDDLTERDAIEATAERLQTGERVIPTVTSEPDISNVGLAEKSEPPPKHSEPPPAARSGAVPTAPPRVAKPPPATSSSEQRARAAFGDDDDSESAMSDLSLDELGDASNLSENRTGIIVGIVAFLAIVGFIVAYAVGLDTSGSEMEKEVDRTQVDPDMLIVGVAPKAERVMVNLETTPADASVVVNGLPADPGSQVALVKGQKNEINVYAPGHKPGRVYIDGDGSGSPVGVTLEPFGEEGPPPEDLAELDVLTEPRDATVWVDGVEVGKSPTTVSGLWTGADHHVYVEAEGRYAYTGYIGLVKGSKNLVETKLEKLGSGKKNYVEVIFSAIPRGTMVQMEGEAGALMTPTFKNLDRNTFLTVALEEPDSIPQRRHLALEDVGTFELRPFLQPMKREKGTITVFVEPMGPEIYVGANAYGQGPAGNIVAPEGTLKVVLDTAHGRQEVAVDVVANTHTRYTVSHDRTGAKVTKKD